MEGLQYLFPCCRNEGTHEEGGRPLRSSVPERLSPGPDFLGTLGRVCYPVDLGSCTISLFLPDPYLSVPACSRLGTSVMPSLTDPHLPEHMPPSSTLFRKPQIISPAFLQTPWVRRYLSTLSHVPKCLGTLQVLKKSAAHNDRTSGFCQPHTYATSGRDCRVPTRRAGIRLRDH